MPETIKITDRRKINPTTKTKMNPNKDLKSMKADPYMIKNIYNTARDYGIDPNLMLAVGLQESNLGKTDERNPFRVNSLYHGIDEDPMRQGAAIFRDSYNKYKNKSEAHRIQAYNGLTAKTKANPAYGNSVISLRDSVIKQSPELQGYLTQLDSAYNAYNKPMKKRPQTNQGKLNPFQQAIFGMTGQIFGEGGKSKPYVTNDPNDPRIQAYKDSSDLYIKGLINKSKVIDQINHDIRVFNQNKGMFTPNLLYSSSVDPSLVGGTHNVTTHLGKEFDDMVQSSWKTDGPLKEKHDKINPINTAKITAKSSETEISRFVPQYKKPVQEVIYQKPTIKKTVKPVAKAKPKTVTKPVESTPVATPQVTPEAQTQTNTGGQNDVTLGVSSPDSSTGKRLYRLGNKNITEQQFNQYKTLGKHKIVEYGLGGTIGSLLQSAAPIAGLIPGVGTLVGAAAGVVGNSLQQLDSGQKWDPTQTIGAGIQGATGMKVPGKMAQGGMSGLTPINVEGHNVDSISMAKAKKGELLVNNGQMIKNYISRPPHPEKGQNPLGDDLVQPGSIVIPKNRSQEYLNAGRALRKQIEASVVSQQVAREGNMMRKGGQAGRSKMLPGGMAKDYFDREYPYAPSLNPNVGYTQVETGGNDYMLGDAYRNGRAGVPASFNNMSPMTPRNPFNSGYDQNLRTQRDDISNPYGQGTPEEGDDKPKMSPFDKLNLAQLGLNAVPAIGDILDMTAKVQTPQFGRLQNVNPNLIDPNTGQSQINQGYRSGYNSLRDSGVYSIKSNRNLVADRMQRSGDQALNIANQNAQIKNQFIGMNTDINKYNLDMQNQEQIYKMQGQAKRREARRNLLDRAPYAVSQYMQNGLYAKMLGI